MDSSRGVVEEGSRRAGSKMSIFLVSARMVRAASTEARIEGGELGTGGGGVAAFDAEGDEGGVGGVGAEVVVEEVEGVGCGVAVVEALYPNA